MSAKKTHVLLLVALCLGAVLACGYAAQEKQPVATAESEAIDRQTKVLVQIHGDLEDIRQHVRTLADVAKSRK